MPKIIILRGNSASGKSTTARALQKKLGLGTLLLSQDYIRREMVYVKDEPENIAITLLENLVAFGYEHCEHIILEGILYADIYEPLFAKITQLPGLQIFAYYFDVPFAETVRRHRASKKANDFGEDEMKKWWREKDYLPTIKESILSEDMPLQEIIEYIYQDIQTITKISAYACRRNL